MREDNKRWLMSVMKTSGSRHKFVENGSYAEDDRHKAQGVDPDDLPTHEAMRSTVRFKNGKINCGPLVRFLRGQTGQDWDDVFSEIMARIPTKLLPYQYMIYWFVADQVELIEGRPWNRRSQRFIWNGEALDPQGWAKGDPALDFKEFYVDPATNRLCHIQQRRPDSIDLE